MTLAITLTGNGTTLHLNNSNGVATVGGAPTAASTTPFMMVDEQYTIQAPNPVPLWSGGPPLRDGSALLDQSRPNVADPFVVAVFGSSPDNTASLIRQLNQVLNAAMPPCVMAVQPNGATNAMYTEIYTAVVQPTTNYHVQPLRGSSTAVVQITPIRAPFFGRLSTGESLMSAVSFANTGTGTPDNIAPYSAGSGDLILEGQPLNISLAMVPTATMQKAWIASVDSRVYDAGSAAAYSSTSTTVGTDSQVSQPTVANALTNHRLKCRVMMRFSAMTSNARIKVKAGINAITFSGVEIDPDNNATIVDMGAVPLDIIRQLDVTTTLRIWINVRSTDGLTATATLSYVETILYYDWCVVSGASLSDTLKQRSFTELTNRVCFAKYPERFMSYSGASPVNPWTPAGTAPRYFNGSSLYVAWLNSSNLHSTTETLNATVTHAPLYLVGRGAG